MAETVTINENGVVMDVNEDQETGLSTCNDEEVREITNLEAALVLAGAGAIGYFVGTGIKKAFNRWVRPAIVRWGKKCEKSQEEEELEKKKKELKEHFEGDKSSKKNK